MTTDVLPEPTAEDHMCRWAEKQGMERALANALARPVVKNLTIRVCYALLNAGIKTRADVIARGTDGLSRVRNLGPRGIAFIRQRLNEAANMNDGFRVVRDENGYGRLRIEHMEPYRPTREEIDATLKSLAKAYPVLVDHASHIDGEFDNALTKTRRMFEALLSESPPAGAAEQHGDKENSNEEDRHQ